MFPRASHVLVCPSWDRKWAGLMLVCVCVCVGRCKDRSCVASKGFTPGHSSLRVRDSLHIASHGPLYITVVYIKMVHSIWGAHFKRVGVFCLHLLNNVMKY